MTQPPAPGFRVIEGTRDAELKRVAIYGSNEELAAAIAVLKRRAALAAVPQAADAPAAPTED